MPAAATGQGIAPAREPDGTLPSAAPFGERPRHIRSFANPPTLAIGHAVATMIPPRPVNLRPHLAPSTMSKVTELSDSDFKNALLLAKTPVLVDFSATWCGPCKALAPTIDKVATDYVGKLAVFKVDIDAASETAAGFQIQSVPTCIFFKNGKEVSRFYGNQDLRAVKLAVDKVLA